MTIEGAIKEILDTAERLLQEGIVDMNGCLSCRAGDAVVITPEGGNLSSLSEGDLAVVKLENGRSWKGGRPCGELPRHLRIYRKRNDISALIHSTQSSVLASSRAGLTVRPLLDDMAQLVGTSIRTAPAGRNSSSLKKLTNAFKGRNSVFIDGQGALCGSSTMDDAHAVCQVTEKACKSFIESSYLGGGIRINPLESWLMRMVYLKKYSKQAVNNR